MKPDTSTGHKGLELEEPLLFELDGRDRSGVDLPEPDLSNNRLGGLERTAPIGLPGLSEPEVVRHFVRLSQKNYSIDGNLYPLGSCTMKHNPRINEKIARMPGFADAHPLQPESTVQGALEVLDTLGHWLKTITGMPAVAMSPAAGAHGELCGLMAIRSAHTANGDPRKRVLVPESAHGTNPATATLCGYKVDPVPGNDRGRIDLSAVKAKLGDDVAAIMLTNPNTLGLFEDEVLEVAEAIHSVGGYFYCDGANLNAIVGRVRPGDLGVDAMHINLHKTFSTPHGGGGPGSGPVAFSEALAPFAPLPQVVTKDGKLHLLETKTGEAAQSFGRLRSFHGQMGMFTRALAYMMSHGADGLRQIAEDAVLSANYVLSQLQDDMSVAYPAPCMHEVLFDDTFLEGTGVTTLDFAKAMIDEGYHPMTVYFPLVVHGAMLTEPTESESKASLDNLISTLKYLADKAKSGDATHFTEAPRLAPRRRVDETAAARNPVLRWAPPSSPAQAAE
ncbi:MAG: aminomethyl-transferring glycine dehydrogenase subunit GcvPB [Alphaproteobacteria bacterium]|jgi:glycine dehydrogenase subunit 2|nr:aminomethyl-transferring glycine dehydrogenase subunit GcvPB [Alphaproteobacteria bacterium]MBT5861070.1 aminomethyl-transferring glycine dehydrogenase subunit GcvPB [Alphaproteobacteria bacterium]